MQLTALQGSPAIGRSVAAHPVDDDHEGEGAPPRQVLSMFGGLLAGAAVGALVGAAVLAIPGLPRGRNDYLLAAWGLGTTAPFSIAGGIAGWKLGAPD